MGSRPLVFMMGKSPAFLPVDRQYTCHHTWALPIEGGYRVGLSAYAVRLLGDVRHLEWSIEAGAAVAAGQPIGYAEASKATSDLYAPLVGRIGQINADVLENPTLINSDLYNTGWLLTFLTGHGTLLLSPQQYLEHLAAVWPLAQRLLKGQIGRREAGGQ